MIRRKSRRAGFDGSEAGAELGFEAVGQMQAARRLIVGNSCVEILLNRWMEFEGHLRARRTPAQNASSVSGFS